jgi:apurinic endonuclease APN1
MKKSLIGAHVSTAGGYSEALRRLAAMGGNVLQMFSSSPRNWRPNMVTDEAVKNFKKLREELGIRRAYFHASYLVNLANPEMIGSASKTFLINELNLAGRLGVSGSIIHVGSFKKETPDYGILKKRIGEILAATPKETLFIIENSGNRKIGLTLDEIGRIMEEVEDPRVKVCLDTCHLHAAGYDISSKEKLDEFLGEFDKKIGLERLEVWHVNDSRDPFGSFRDRHDNVGEGLIDKKVFELLLNHPKTKDMPFVIETPGFKGEGPDKENIDILKSLIKK